MHSSITELYRVFKSYRLGDDFSGCECCVSGDDSERLASSPLSELTVEDLNRFAFKSMTTWGDVRHFKHFLPRLLELALDDYESFNDPEVLLGKLAYAKWKTWPNYEQTAVNDFLMHFWEVQLSKTGRFPNDTQINTVLGGLANACHSIRDYLDLWIQIRTSAASLHLCQFVDTSVDEIIMNRRIRLLWGNPSKPTKELLEWISSDAVREYLDETRSDTNHQFPLVFEQLSGIRSRFLEEESEIQ